MPNKPVDVQIANLERFVAAGDYAGMARVITGGGNACGFHLDAVAGQGFGKVSPGD